MVDINYYSIFSKELQTLAGSSRRHIRKWSPNNLSYLKTKPYLNSSVFLPIGKLCISIPDQVTSGHYSQVMLESASANAITDQHGALLM